MDIRIVKKQKPEYPTLVSLSYGEAFIFARDVDDKNASVWIAIDTPYDANKTACACLFSGRVECWDDETPVITVKTSEAIRFALEV